ncbi:MAG: SirB2 family protein [Rhizobacter sp.]|nr:SirB2 family protein [Bacteriovorax sp.]
MKNLIISKAKDIVALYSSYSKPSGAFMISYETYKILHIFMIMMTLSATGAVIAEGRWMPRTSFKAVIGILSFLILVGGMGLLARLGFKHGEGFPTWVYIKIVMWIILNVSLVILFRSQQKNTKILFAWIAFASVFVAVYTAVTKLQ